MNHSVGSLFVSHVMGYRTPHPARSPVGTLGSHMLTLVLLNILSSFTRSVRMMNMPQDCFH